MKLILKILAGIILVVFYLLSPVIYLVVWVSSLGVKLIGGVLCLVAVVTYFEKAETLWNTLILVFVGLVFIGISPFFSFISIFCEEIRAKLFTYITGYSDF